MRVGIAAALITVIGTTAAVLLTPRAASPSGNSTTVVSSRVSDGSIGVVYQPVSTTQSPAAGEAEAKRHDAERVRIEGLRALDAEAAKRAAQQVSAEADGLFLQVRDLLIPAYHSTALYAQGTSPLTLDQAAIRDARAMLRRAVTLSPDDYRGIFLEATALRAESIIELRRGDPECHDRCYAKVREAADLLQLTIDAAERTGVVPHPELRRKAGEMLTVLAEFGGDRKQALHSQALSHLLAAHATDKTQDMGCAATCFNIAQNLAGLRRPSESIYWNDLALQYAPVVPEYRLGLLVAYAEAGRAADAEKYLATLPPTLLQPIEGLVSAVKAIVAIHREQFDTAIELLDDAERQNFSVPDLRFRRAEALLALGDAAGAKGHVLAALAHDPKDPMYLDLRAKIEARMRK